MIEARAGRVKHGAVAAGFFTFTGLRTQIGLLGGAEDWLWCAGIVLVASLGKFGGSFAAARLTGLGSRDAAAIGVSMNTRGLMEMIVLDVGLDLACSRPSCSRCW